MVGHGAMHTCSGAHRCHSHLMWPTERYRASAHAYLTASPSIPMGHGDRQGSYSPAPTYRPRPCGRCTAGLFDICAELAAVSLACCCSTCGALLFLPFGALGLLRGSAIGSLLVMGNWVPMNIMPMVTIGCQNISAGISSDIPRHAEH